MGASLLAKGIFQVELEGVPAPLLYDLTSLQREAANRYGFSAKRTLQLAQECYEKHKVLTYPRTDSRYLPEDYLGKVYGIVGTVAEQGGRGT